MLHPGDLGIWPLSLFTDGFVNVSFSLLLPSVPPCLRLSRYLCVTSIDSAQNMADVSPRCPGGEPALVLSSTAIRWSVRAPQLADSSCLIEPRNNFCKVDFGLVEDRGGTDRAVVLAALVFLLNQ